MGWNDEVRSLERKLVTARTCFTELRALNGRVVAFPFAEWLQQEKQRSGRYNHYFSLLVLVSLRLSAPAILRRVSGSLRASDILGLVDGDGKCRLIDRILGHGGHERYQMVGIILPQTDRTGAQITAKRLKSMLAAEEEVSIGMAVFPDDSTDPEELLDMAHMAHVDQG